MTAASRSLATALWRARFASGLLRRSYTTWRDTTLKELRTEAKRRMHSPVAKQHEWLSAVLRGHFAYFGLPSNMRSMASFAYEVKRLWRRALARRSQRGMTWDRFNQLMKAYPLPMPTVTRSVRATPALAMG